MQKFIWLLKTTQKEIGSLNLDEIRVDLLRHVCIPITWTEWFWAEHKTTGLDNILVDFNKLLE